MKNIPWLITKTVLPACTRGSEENEESMKFRMSAWKGEEVFLSSIVQVYKTGGNCSQFVLMLEKSGLHCGYRAEKKVEYMK